MIPSCQNLEGVLVAKTVNQGFQELRQRLEITDLQATDMAERQQRVREAVKKGLLVVDDFLTGSYMRNTMIAPLKEADIDIFIVLDGSLFDEYKPASLLDKVKNILNQSYRETTDISRAGQAVTISFHDFKVDVVPAFPRKLLFLDNGYRIADTLSGQWLPTNPKEHIQIWSKANKKHNGNLIPLIKMIKCWNRENGSLLHSFHLECLILKILEDRTIPGYPSAVKLIFDKARSIVRYPVSDPAGYNSNVGAYLKIQGKKDEVVSQFELAYRRAKNAEEWVRQGNIEDAYYYWWKIFGDYFPAYG